MNALTAETAIRQRWMTMWPAAAGPIPYAFDTDTMPANNGTFARVELVPFDSEQATLGRVGGRKFERLGWIDVRVFGPTNAGGLTLKQLGQNVLEIFESARFAKSGDDEFGVITQESLVGKPEASKDYPGLYVLFIRTPFSYYETR